MTPAAHAGSSRSAAAPAAAHRIDVHHHILPQRYLEAAGIERIAAQSPRQSHVAIGWTPAQSIEEMDRNGVALAITSVSAPGIWFGDDAAAVGLARECNEYAARMKADFRGRFGSFAALALPDVEASLREIEYGLDVLDAEGFALMSCYGNRWPGDSLFAPVFDELNRRKAVVFFHPNVSDACRGLLPGVPASTLEFPLDTTRAVMSLLYSGTFSRCPDIRFIFAHAGGAVPFLAHRMARLEVQEDFRPHVPHGAMHELTRQYYDTALAANRPALAALMEFVPASQVLYGSDAPFAPGMMAKTVAGLSAYGFAPSDLHSIERANALALLPGLIADGARAW
jgi:predicted TIM-barrel fold metal-dependent hydrolase